MLSVENRLKCFLSTADTKVISLKGEWGVGKTYFWNAFIEEQRATLTKQNNFKGYSYVSVFGLSSIAEIRQQIVSKIDIFSDSLAKKGFSSVSKWSDILKEVKVKGVSTSFMADIIQNNILQNLIICIDDLERKENSISTSSILGLISELAEQRNCKIVIVYNDQNEALNSETSQSLAEYKEKVIDFEISYKPSLKQNIKLIWPDTIPHGLEEVLEEFECHNIRIMKKMKSAIAYFQPFLETQFPYLWVFFQRKLIIFSVIHHRHQHDIDIEDKKLLNLSRYLPEDFSKQESERYNITEKNRPVLRHLHKLMFYHEDFDPIIIQFLKNGSVDLTCNFSLFDEKNYDSKKSQARDAASKISSQYWNGSFSYTQEDFVTEVNVLLTDHWQSLDLYQVINSINEVRKLLSTGDWHEDTLCKKIEHSAIHEGVDFSHLNKLLQDYPEEKRSFLLSKAKNCKRKWTPSKPIENIMLEMLPAMNGCNPQYMNDLLGYTKKDFYDWMLTSNLALKHLKFFNKWFPDDLEAKVYSSVEIETIRKVQTSLQAAIKDIKKISDFNAQRLNKAFTE